jgi:uncharacterized membrane protein YfcA
MGSRVLAVVLAAMFTLGSTAGAAAAGSVAPLIGAAAFGFVAVGVLLLVLAARRLRRRSRPVATRAQRAWRP